jgi:hypothetical protein
MATTSCGSTATTERHSQRAAYPPTLRHFTGIAVPNAVHGHVGLSAAVGGNRFANTRGDRSLQTHQLAQ